MAGEWHDAILGDIIELKRGYDLPQSLRTQGDVPIVSSSGLTDYHNTAMVKGPGVVTGRYGTLRRVFYIESDFWPVNTALYVCNFKGNDARFISYFLRTLDFLAYSDKAAVPGVNRNHLHQARVRVPADVAEQRAIAHILGTLDDKIELNRRMSETLEAIAQALFESWFLTADVTPTTTSDLIGEGVLQIGDGYRAKNSELGPSGLPFIRAGDLNNGFDAEGAERLCETSVARAGDKVCQVGDVAFTSKGTIGRFARVDEHSGKFVYSPQVCFWRSLDHRRLHPAILYCWMQTDDLGRQIRAVAAQTDMAPYVSLYDQRRMMIPRFPSTHLAIAARIQPLLDRKSLSAAQSRTLASLRDTLLPKLISGELRLKDAERLVAAAL